MKYLKYVILITLLTVFCFPQELLTLDNNKENLFDFNVNSKSKSNLELTLEINSFQYDYVEENGQNFIKPIMSGMGLKGGDGLPHIPIIRKKVLIPEGAELRINVTNVVWEKIQLEYPLFPRQLPQSKSEEKLPFFINDKIYNSNEIYPNEKLGKVYRFGVTRGYHFAGIELIPFKYEFENKILHIAKKIVFEVNIVGGNYSKSLENAQNKFSYDWDKYLSHKFINFSDYQVKDKDYYGEGMIVLYGDSSFMADIPGQMDFTDVVAWKRKKGWKVEEYVVGIDVANDPASIRAFFLDKYSTWSQPSLSYALIVGNETNVVTYDAGEHVTDHYYACLDGDFNSDVRDRDIHFGRISLGTSETSTFIPLIAERIVKYEKADYTDFSWMKKFALIAGHDSSHCASHGYHSQESVRTNFTNNPETLEYPITGTWPNNPEPGGDMLYRCVVSPQCSSDGSEVILVANDGRTLIDYTAHGSNTTWADPSMSISDVAGFTNTQARPFMIGHCCNTGIFEGTSDCFGEGILKGQNGPIVYLGASDSTYWDEDDTMARDMYSAIFNRHYSWTFGTPTDYGTYTGTFDVGTSFGVLNTIGCEALELVDASRTDYYFRAYHIFGDASLDLWTNTPTNLVVTTAPVHAVGVPVKEVTVTDAKTKAPVEGAKICFSSSNFKILGVTDSNGMVTLDFGSNPPTIVEMANLVITGHNIKPYEQDIQIIAASCGIILMDKSSYNCSSVVKLSLYDADLTAATFAVDISSTTSPSLTSIILDKTQYGYSGTVELIEAPQQPGNCQLQVTNGDTITAYYSDSDCDGTPQNVTATATLDCVGPTISNVNWTTDLGKFTITWDTNEPSTSRIDFGPDVNSMSLYEENTAKTTSHSLTATDLGEARWFILKITSVDSQGNSVTDTNNGEYYKIPVPGKLFLINENMDTNPNWAISGSNWAYGQPTGSCTYADPTAGYTGNNVYGVSLDGCYPDGMSFETLTTPAFDCSSHSIVYLSYMKWNGCESNSYDHSTVQISTNGTDWTTLWENGSTFQDTSWIEDSYDISQYAANQPTVYIRWTMGTSDGSQTRSGWNIDDVQVYSTQDPDPLEPVPSMGTIGLLLILGLFTIIIKKFK